MLFTSVREGRSFFQEEVFAVLKAGPERCQALASGLMELIEYIRIYILFGEVNLGRGFKGLFGTPYE